MENLPTDYFVTSIQFTKTTHRDVYPAIDPSSPSNSLAGKVVVITGASQGLGARSFAPSFAKANPKGIVLVARSESSLHEVSNAVQAINDKIEVLAVPTDIKNPESVSNLWAQVKEKFGKADILVNNAATADAGLLAEADPEKWWSDFETNVYGAFLLNRGFLHLLGPTNPGHILNINTGAAILINPTLSSYSLSKLAAFQMNGFIAAENPNVTTIALHPGILKTNMTMDMFLRFALDTPELPGGTAVWLMRDEAKFLSGRWVAANWDVQDLKAREEEIVKGDLLTVKLVGKLGKEQFE